MVFFTCNKCGESLKKKDVEKHCGMRCKGSPFLTCIDCLKDFRDDYAKHTTCVSEKDRYSSQGLKGVQKSKQQIWVETVHDCCSRAFDDGLLQLTPSIKQLLIWLQDQSNIPDKFKTFSNYISNARRAEPAVNIEFVWNILDKARTDLQAKLKVEREAADAEKRKAKEANMKNMKKGSSDSDASDSSDEDKEKEGMINKSDKGTQSEEEEEAAKASNGKKDKKKKRMVSESESVINGSSELRKTKKPKKNPDSQEAEDGSNLNSALNACHLNGERIVEEDNMLSKKQRKEKKKREKYEAEVKKIESTEAEAESVAEPEVENIVETEGKKGKKKKNKKNVEESVPLVEPQTETKERKKKEKKNKRHLQEEADPGSTEVSDKRKKNGQSKSGVLNEDLDTEQSAQFSWETAILQVLGSQEEISVKRLSKKVLNEYLVSLGDEAHIDEVKIMNKFHKKLDKMHNVLVHKDKVRLRTSRD